MLALRSSSGTTAPPRTMEIIVHGKAADHLGVDVGDVGLSAVHSCTSCGVGVYPEH